MKFFPIEGDIILTEEGLFCEVKGFTQPKDKVVAFVRYVPSNLMQNNTRDLRPIHYIGLGPEDQEFFSQKVVKIIDLRDKISFMKEKFPEAIYTSQNYYFPMQAFDPERVKYHFRPEEFVRFLASWDPNSNLPAPIRDAFDLCQWLSDQSGVPLDYFGITGSLLSGTWREDSDLDLIIYGFGNSLRVREIMRNHFNAPLNGESENSLGEFRRYNTVEFRTLFKTRGEHQGISFYTFLGYEVRKLHQGIFRGRSFFIRFLEFENREKYRSANEFENRRILNIGKVHIHAEIRGDQFWWTTPARVELANVNVLEDSTLINEYEEMLNRYNLSLRDIVLTFTLRGRYTENVRLLEQIEAEGTLELVISNQTSAILQLALGSSATDFLTPL